MELLFGSSNKEIKFSKWKISSIGWLQCILVNEKKRGYRVFALIQGGK